MFLSDPAVVVVGSHASGGNLVGLEQAPEAVVGVWRVRGRYADGPRRVVTRVLVVTRAALRYSSSRCVRYIGGGGVEIITFIPPIALLSCKLIVIKTNASDTNFQVFILFIYILNIYFYFNGKR